jgi:hypothetical protein
MWFIIRTAFCVGVVFSMAPGGDASTELGSAQAALSALAAPSLRNLAEGAFSICQNDTKLCLEAAQRLAGLGGDLALPAPKAGAPAGTRLVSDTLTSADRAAPWHGNSKEQRPAARLRFAARR